MIVAKIKVDGVSATADYRKTITAGMIGAQVQFDYVADLWAGLHKTVVFRGAVTKDVITDAEVVTIPAEVVAKHGYPLRVGVYGVDADGNIAIPTIWADLRTVRDAADPSGDTTTDPSLPVWAQIQAMIGNLDDLDTTAKNNLVAAVNEAMTKGGGEVDAAEIQRIVEDYLASNPPTVTESDPTVPAWAKQPTKPTYTAAEVGALPVTYTPPNQTAQQVGADPAGTAASAVAKHNTDATAHNDLRIALQELANRVNAALDSDDTTLDQMSEVVAYIKSNKTLIDAIMTSKVSVADIVNDLVTNVTDKPLSAAQGVALKGLIEELRTLIPEGGSGISVTGATVGQTVKIVAVDDDGVPTAWEPVDFPSGGGSGGSGVLELLVKHTVTAEESLASSITFTKDAWPLIDGQEVVIARVVKPEGKAGWTKMTLGKNDVCQTSGNTHLSQIFYAETKHGFWGGASSSDSNFNGGANLVPSIYTAFRADLAPGLTPYEYYDSIKLYSYTTVFPEGTTIEIYGGRLA